MKKILLLILALPVLLAACGNEDENAGVLPETNAAKTIFMYFPYSGSTNDLYNYFQQNIADLETGIAGQNGLGDNKVMVFMASNATEGVLYQIKYEKGACVHDTIKTYQNKQFNTASWITYILNQVKSYAPADTFAMNVGSHGMGWLYAESEGASSAFSVRMKNVARQKAAKMPTRWFGGISVMTDIATLAEGIAASGVGKLQYLLFDDCFMQNIETVYELKDVTEYLVASPTEILAFGMPYSKIWPYLAAKNPDYQAVCDKFYEFYSGYTYDGQPYPYGTLGISKCSEIDSLAAIVKEINAVDTLDLNDSQRAALQAYEPLSKHLFFDLSDVIASYCSDSTLLAKFQTQLGKTVPYTCHTESFYSSMRFGYNVVKINSFCGISTSAPSIDPQVTGYYTRTGWYKATN